MRLFEKQETRFILLLMVNFHASASGSAFRIRIQDSQINADPHQQHWLGEQIKLGRFQVCATSQAKLGKTNIIETTSYSTVGAIPAI
jgi:hypothetical protein